VLDEGAIEAWIDVRNYILSVRCNRSPHDILPYIVFCDLYHYIRLIRRMRQPGQELC
jgi:hypothetical protein